MVHHRLRPWRSAPQQPRAGGAASKQGTPSAAARPAGARGRQQKGRGDSAAAEDGISLRRLFPNARLIGAEDILATGVVCDPHQCQAGQVVVIDGLHCEPDEAAAAALARGAAGIVCEQLLPCPLPQCLVADAGQAAALLAAAVAGNPQNDVYVVGVVGPAGKTSVALLTAAVLRASGFRTAFDTDLGQCDGVVQTTPATRAGDPLAMADLFSTARDAGSRVMVLELSESMLRSAALAAVGIDLLVVTGVPGRGDGFGPRPLELALQRLRPSGLAVVSADSPQAIAAARSAGAALVTYGLRRPATVTGKIFEQLPGQTTLMITAGDCTAALEAQLTGPTMAANQLAAVTVGLMSQMPLERAIAAVAQVTKLPGRVERITGFDTAAVVLDAASDAARLSGTLRGLRRERGCGRLWCILSADAATAGGVDDVGCAALGAAAERYADHVIITAPAGQKRSFLSQAHAILDGVRTPGGPRLIADRNAAIAWAVSHAAPEDTILVAGGYAADGPHRHRQTIESDRAAVQQARTLPQVPRTPQPKILRFPGLAASNSETKS